MTTQHPRPTPEEMQRYREAKEQMGSSTYLAAVALAHHNTNPDRTPWTCPSCGRDLSPDEHLRHPVICTMLRSDANQPAAPAAHLAVRILPNDKGNPPGKVADAELHFLTGPLSGCKLIGFGVWERRGGGGFSVTFPARQYSVNGERRSFALLRPTSDYDAQTRARDLVIDAFELHKGTDGAQDSRWTYDANGCNLDGLNALRSMQPGQPGTATPMPAAQSTETTRGDDDPILALAEDRGRRGDTFATADELHTPGYDAAYQRGRLTAPTLAQTAEAITANPQIDPGIILGSSIWSIAHTAPPAQLAPPAPSVPRPRRF